ncbi:MAG: hypothetical protein MRJ67_00300 [Nitrospirales bacterium]|nr:hypothetical protein [Nitrospirales bacterium]
MTTLTAVPVAVLLRQIAPQRSCPLHPQHPIHVFASILRTTATPPFGGQ